MADTATSIQFFKDLEMVVSKTRFDSYRGEGTSHAALSRYIWNTVLCESLYPSFQILEVGFRNAVHAEISTQVKNMPWLTQESAFLYETEIQAIKTAKLSLAGRAVTITEPSLIAEMSFGFWTSLLDSRYETMWHKIIAGVFPNMPRAIRTRKEASKLMNTARKLRNAALHHHSIWHWRDLKDQHAHTQILIGWICKTIADISSRIDRFPGVYSAGFKIFEKMALEISECRKPDDGTQFQIRTLPSV